MQGALMDRGRGVLAWVLVALGVLWLGAAAPEAVADGKAFTRQVAVPAEMPDQEALIVHRDGMQTLVIETNVRTKADELAWVVPLPSVPEISETTTGVFPTLRALTAPRLVRSNPQPAFFASLLLLALLGLLVMKSGWGRVMLYILAIVLAGFCMMPTLGKARSAGGSITTGGVEVVSRDIVGSYTTEVIRSEDPGALVAWLREHGYECPDETKPAIAAYVAKKWVFAAMQLRKGDQAKGEVLTPHPLVFKFESAKPVYPMELTLPQHEDFSLALYVFADSRCQADGMHTELADKVWYEPREVGNRWDFRSRWYTQPADFIVSHDTVDSIVRPATFVTKLTRSWKAGQAANDILLEAAPAVSIRKEVWSKEDAVGLGVQTGMIVALLGTIAAVIGRASGCTLASALKCVLVAFVVAIGAAVLHAGMLPTADTVRMRERGRDAEDVLNEVFWRTDEVAKDERVDEAWIRARLAQVIKQIEAESKTQVQFGEGDRPGDYRLVVDESDGHRTLHAYGFAVTGHQYLIHSIALRPATEMPTGPITPAPAPDPPSGR